MKDRDTHMIKCEKHPGYRGLRRPNAKLACVCMDVYIYALAKRNGCKPFWWEYYLGYCCGCKDEFHYLDQQCSTLSLGSASQNRNNKKSACMTCGKPR